MTVFAALRCVKGHVFAFEPHPESFKYLLRNIKLNNLKNVSAYNIALGLSKRHVNFYPNTEFVGKSSTQVGVNISPIKVHANLLDNVIPEGIKIDVIKIDTEGEELQILKSARKTIIKNQPVLIVEYSPETKNHKLLLKYLGNLKKYYFYVPRHGRYYDRKLVAIKKLTGYRGKLTNIICVPERFLGF